MALLAQFIVAASSSSNSCSLSTTISASSAVQNLNACATLEGTIEITGDEIAALDLSSVKSVAADLTIFNSSSITSVNLEALTNVTGSIEFDALTQLNSINFAELTSAEELSFISLPSLVTLNLNSGLANVSSLTLSDTAISSIDSLLNFQTVGYLNVNNNKNISSIDLSTLETVSEGLTLSFNNDDATIKLENLIWASNLTIQDVGSISASSLEAVNGTFIVGYNAFDTVSFDALESVGASLQVFANDNLESLYFPNLTTVDGELRIWNNSLLSEIDMDNLEKVGGALYITGDFANFTLSDLDEVDGDFTLSSTNKDFSCKEFNELHDDDKIKGHNYNCSSPTSTAVSSGSATSSGSSKTSGSSDSSGSSGSSSSSSSSSTKASGAGYLAPGMLISTIVGAAFALLM